MSIRIYGRHPVLEALKAHRKMFKVYATDAVTPSLLAPFEAQGIPIQTVSKNTLDQWVGTQHQGLAADVEDYVCVPLNVFLQQHQPKHLILLDGIHDPHNFGAIIRTAEAMGMGGLVIGKHRRAPITATVVKVSTGAIETLPLIEAGNLANALEQLKQAGYWIYGLDLNTDRTLDDIPKDVNVCLVLGNEGSGLSSLIKKRCDVLVTIPMYGQTNSLNVSVAAGMAMHHLSKAR